MPPEGVSHKNTHKQPETHLFLDKAVAHGAFLTLVCDSVVEIVQLTFVTLIAHEALATVAGAVTVTLHGDGAHRVTVTGWERRGRGGRRDGTMGGHGGEQRQTFEELEMASCVICIRRCIRGRYIVQWRCLK